jgi:hypothetical protein
LRVSLTTVIRFLVIGIGCVVLSAAAVMATAATSPPPIVVTRDDGSMPGYCGPAAVARKAAAFVRAINSGSAKRLRRYFGVEFWAFHVAVNQPNGPSYRVDTRTKDGVFRYAARRHRQHEIDRLLALSVIYDRALDAAGFAVELSVTADDLQPASGALFAGKAEITCKTGRLVVWSVATPVVGGLSICPQPPDGNPYSPINTCTALPSPR